MKLATKSENIALKFHFFLAQSVFSNEDDSTVLPKKYLVRVKITLFKSNI